MRSGVMWRLFLIVLAVGNGQVLASGGNRGLPTDDKVAIVLNSSELLFGRCPKGPARTMKVRLQALKTKSGAIFRRKVLSADAFACLAALGSKTLAASSFLECSKKAEAAGLKMFRWDGGLCTGYTNGIPVNIARCPGAGSVVLYSVDVQAPKSPVVSNLTHAFSDSSTINASWGATPSSCFDTYRVSFNNIDTFVSHKLVTVSLETTRPCAEYNLTVTPVDANHAVMGTAATVKVVLPKARELSLNLTHGVTAVRASWEATYTCNPNMRPMTGGPIKSYSVTLGSQTKTTTNSTFEFTLSKETARCNDTASSLAASLKQVTVVALDGTGAELATVTATLTDTIMPGHRYAIPNDNCFYYQKVEESPGGVGYTYDQVRNFCQKTMLSGPFDGLEGLAKYNSDISNLASRSPSISVLPHYVGLKRDSSSGMWMWLKNVEPVSGADWDSDEPSAAGDCVKLNVNGKLAAVSCATPMPAVCYDLLT